MHGKYGLYSSAASPFPMEAADCRGRRIGGPDQTVRQSADRIAIARRRMSGKQDAPIIISG
jgi:hypothetical protein